MSYLLLKKFANKAILKYKKNKVKRKIKKYILNGRIPWSDGYFEFRTEEIKKVINSDLINFRNSIPNKFGIMIDERIVEYPWIFSNLSHKEGMLLDAGSTFNFDYIVNHQKLSKKQLSIFTYYPELNNYSQKRVSYIYGDLRNMPYKDGLFDEIICQSTIEHIDMDNSIYGYQINNSTSKMEKSYEYILAIEELYRVLKPNGMLLLTIPFGKYENHGFFQQFDLEMIERLMKVLPNGRIDADYFKYTLEGWKYSSLDECIDCTSYNPHTGLGKGNDGAAHSRSVCCIRFNKS